MAGGGGSLYWYGERTRGENGGYGICKICLSRDLKNLPGQAILIANYVEKLY